MRAKITTLRWVLIRIAIVLDNFIAKVLIINFRNKYVRYLKLSLPLISDVGCKTLREGDCISSTGLCTDITVFSIEDSI